MTKAGNAKLLRERMRAKFEEQRELARQKLESALSSRGRKGCSEIRGQLGQPFLQFSEVSARLAKLQPNVDLIMAGELSVQELCKEEEEVGANCNDSQLSHGLLSGGGALSHKAKKSAAEVGGGLGGALCNS